MKENNHSRRVLLISILILLTLILAGGFAGALFLRKRRSAPPSPQAEDPVAWLGADTVLDILRSETAPEPQGRPAGMSSGADSHESASAAGTTSETAAAADSMEVPAGDDSASAKQTLTAAADTANTMEENKNPAEAGTADPAEGKKDPASADAADPADPADAKKGSGEKDAQQKKDDSEKGAQQKEDDSKKGVQQKEDEKTGESGKSESKTKDNSKTDSGKENKAPVTVSRKTLTELQKAHVEDWEAFFGREFPLNAPVHDYNWKYLSYDDNGTIQYEGDKHYTVRHGIDVSEFQGEIDWKKVRKAGFDFAFIRVGYRMFDTGDLHADTRAIKNLKAATKAGFDVGVYIFSQAVSEKEARDEAALCLKVIQKAGVEVTLPIVFDPEIQIEYYSRINYLTREQFTDNVVAFCETIEKAGYTPAIYANCSTQTDILDMSRLTDAVLWNADYNMVPQSPYRFTFWQYSDYGWVDGIPETATDLNLWFIEK